jgi:hypothetical protein
VGNGLLARLLRGRVPQVGRSDGWPPKLLRELDRIPPTGRLTVTIATAWGFADHDLSSPAERSGAAPEKRHAGEDTSILLNRSQAIRGVVVRGCGSLLVWSPEPFKRDSTSVESSGSPAAASSVSSSWPWP